MTGIRLNKEQTAFFAHSIFYKDGLMEPVYHGSYAHFTRFSPLYIGSGNGNDKYGLGYYFTLVRTAHARDASLYGPQRAYLLNITHPFMLMTDREQNGLIGSASELAQCIAKAAAALQMPVEILEGMRSVQRAAKLLEGGNSAQRSKKKMETTIVPRAAGELRTSRNDRSAAVFNDRSVRQSERCEAEFPVPLYGLIERLSAELTILDDRKEGLEAAKDGEPIPPHLKKWAEVRDFEPIDAGYVKGKDCRETSADSGDMVCLRNPTCIVMRDPENGSKVGAGALTRMSRMSIQMGYKTALCRAFGYDGAIAGTAGAEEIIAFFPEQIKAVHDLHPIPASSPPAPPC